MIIYQLFTGKTPFRSDGQLSTLDKIVACDYHMPSEDKIPIDAQDLIRKLLVVEPDQRLGAGTDESANGMAALKSHHFFTGINFSQLHKQEAPIKCTPIKCTMSAVST